MTGKAKLGCVVVFLAILDFWGIGTMGCETTTNMEGLRRKTQQALRDSKKARTEATGSSECKNKPAASVRKAERSLHENSRIS